MRARQRAVLGLVVSLLLLLSPWMTSPAWADPTADHGGPYFGNVDEKVDFDGSGSQPGDHPIKTYLWDFGDGSPEARGKITSHRYQSADTFVVTLTVIDTADDSSTATTTATIVDPTTTTTTTSTTTSTSTTSTTTKPPTTSTTTNPPTTSTTTSPPTTSTTTNPPTSSTSTTSTTTSPSTTSTTVATGSTTSTSEPTTTSIETDPEPGADIVATTFSVFPTAVDAKSEIALTVELEASAADSIGVRFLLDGARFGDPVTVDVWAAPSGADRPSVFTRKLPADLSVGSHRVELVTITDPPRVLGSGTFEVVSSTESDSPSVPEAPEATGSDARNPSPIMALAGGIGVVLTAAGLAAWRRIRSKPGRSG